MVVPAWETLASMQTSTIVPPITGQVETTSVIASRSAACTTADRAGQEPAFQHWLGHVLGGWSVGMLGTLQSGPPFTVTTQTNNSNAFSAGAQRANVTGDPQLPSHERTLSRWFNTDAFSQPAPFTFGNSGRGIVRGDGIVNVDLSLTKNVDIGPRRFVQVRVELFNAFNHPNFGLPGHTFGAPDFGVVSSASGGRTIQLGLRGVF